MHDHLIDDASGVQVRKGRKRAVAALLAAVVAMVTIAVGANTAGATTPLPLANPLPYTSVGGCAATTSGLVASAKVTWTKPSPSDYINGYLITIIPAGSTSLSQTPPPFSVGGADTLTATIPNLVPGGQYNFVIQSVNLDSQVNSGIAASQCNNPSNPLVANAASSPAQASAFTFATNDAAIKRHYEELLQRDPNFSELAFWDRYFANSIALVGSCGTGGRGTNVPVQYALDPAATSTIGGFCPNSGPEFDLMNLLIFGENNAIGQPFDTGGFYGNFNRKTYAGAAEPVTRLYFAYFGRIADFGGFKYWYKKYQAGKSISAISDFFAHSSEFKRQYGTLSDADFVTLVYLNVLARNPDFGGQNFWRGQLEGGLSRGSVMAKFSESDEYNRISSFAVKTTILYAALLGRVPTKAEEDTAVNLLNGAWDAWCINTNVDEIQTVTLGTTVSTYTLTFNGSTTGAIQYNATAATVQASLEALASVGVGNVAVTGNVGGPYTVEFKGALQFTNLPAMTATPAGGNTGATIQTQQNGGLGGSTQWHYASVTPSQTTPGVTDLAGGALVSQSTATCLQTGIAGGAQSVYFVESGHSGLAYYAAPIVQLLSTIRNSPAYTTAEGKTAALI